MFPRFLILLAAALSGSAAWAQQNMDTYVGFGDLANRAYAINGTSLTAEGSHVFSSVTDFGYQLVRVGPASVWLDVSQIFGSPADLQTSLPGSGRTTWQAYAAGARLRLPFGRRFSEYALAGVGGGLFHAIVMNGASPTVSTERTFHGLFEFGGGIDFRLLRWFSLRLDVRDLVTGDQLGAPGRQHVLPTFGMAFHY